MGYFAESFALFVFSSFQIFMILDFDLRSAQIAQLAMLFGYRIDTVNAATSYVSFVKDDIKLLVYFKKKGYTVASCILHPESGKTQLIRKNIDYSTVRQIFENPRIHTKKGFLS